MFAVRVLIENTTGDPALCCEHGLSLWVGYKGFSLLFDTGQSDGFIANSRTLGIDLFSADALVISHGHYDHSGGLPALLGKTTFSAPLWVGEGFFERKFSLDDTGPRYNGNPFERDLFSSKGITVHTVDGRKGSPVSVEIAKGLHLLAGFPRTHCEECISPRLVLEDGKGSKADAFPDEISLVADLGNSLAVILGCAHPGLMNMLDSVQAHFNKPIEAVFGGAHLCESGAERIEATTRYLAQHGIRLTALGHCTGPVALGYMQHNLPSWKRLHTGAFICV